MKIYTNIYIKLINERAVTILNNVQLLIDHSCIVIFYSLALHVYLFWLG